MSGDGKILDGQTRVAASMEFQRERVAPDNRVFLKIKIKSLASEARIIKAEERKRPGHARAPLTEHRKHQVRKETRDTLLAYGFLRGRTLEQIETHRRTKPRWSNVRRMVLANSHNQARAFDVWSGTGTGE